MEYVMNPPQCRKLDPVHHQRDLFDDLEGSISFGCKLGFLMVKFEIGSF